MTRHDVAVLAFKLLGLWVLLGAVGQLQSAAQLWFTDTSGGAWLFAPATYALVMIGIGIPLWFSADWFAGRVFPGDESEPTAPRPGASAEEIRALAFSVVGLLLLVYAVPELVNVVTFFYGVRGSRLWDSTPGYEPPYASILKAQAAAAAVRLVLGLVLFLGTRTVSRLLRRLKTAVLGPTSLEDPDPAETEPKGKPEP